MSSKIIRYLIFAASKDSSLKRMGRLYTIRNVTKMNLVMSLFVISVVEHNIVTCEFM